jgi:hypothetical protein
MKQLIKTNLQPNNSFYNKNTNLDHPDSVNRLIEESYISPEMQWALFSFLESSGMIIDRITGAAQNIPPINFILGKIMEPLQQQYLLKKDQERIKNTLHSILESIDIATYVASLESAYQDQKYILYQNVNDQVIANLTSLRQNVQTMIKKVQNIIVSDAPVEQSSYFSWLPSFGANNKQQVSISGEYVVVQPNEKTVMIPAWLMPTIVKMNDYKEKPDAIQSANLLFKQCFIAQQHHLKDAYRIKELSINLEGYINANNYIFSNFPNIYDPNSQTYPICEIAKKLIPKGQFRSTLQSLPSNEQKQAHQLLLHIRQAIQTALYIANEKSSFNVGYILPDAVKYYLGTTVSQLMLYDAQLALLCKDPQYGATEEDTYRDDQLAMITKIAAGVLVTAVIGGTMYAYAPTAVSYLTNTASNYLPSWLGGSSTQQTIGNISPDDSSIPTVPSTKSGGSWLPSWLGGSSNSIQSTNSNQPTTGQTVTKYAGPLMQIGGQVAQVGSAVALTANILNSLDKNGKLGTPGSLNEITGGYADPILQTAQNVGSGAALLGGTAAAVGGAASAILNMNSFFGFIGAINATNSATNAVKNSSGYVATTTGSLMKGSQNQQQLPTPQPIPDKIYNGFIQIITTCLSQNIDPAPEIKKGASYLLSQKTDPTIIVTVCTKLQEDTAENPRLANTFGQIIQAITGQGPR